MNPNFNGEKGAADCGSFFLESKKINENTPQIDFHISVETAKNGKEILVINGKAVHSRFAPERSFRAGGRLPHQKSAVCQSGKLLYYFRASFTGF